MKIFLVASECVPFIKTGGLADVVGALPAALKRLGAEVSVLIPKYSMIPQQFRKEMQHITDFSIQLGWRNQYVGVEKIRRDGIDFYFADNEFYFKQDYVYSSGDFEAERYCWFSKAALEIMQKLDIVPDIIHLNDWQTGLIPLLLREQYSALPEFSRVKTVFTIHNLRYQGLMNPMLANDLLSLGQNALAQIEYYCNINCMKAGIIYSDAVTTVSPTYAKEICTPRCGETLDGLLRHKHIAGILNGIDKKLYNPWTDKALCSRFSKNHPQGKQKCKSALQTALGLEQSEERPVAAVISRLTNQKGLDLFRAVIPGLLDLGAQLVILGMGDAEYERMFADLAAINPSSVAFRAEMNDSLARQIYAGADIFLMPSAFEPCGLSQLLAMRYGAIPVVRETGGLADTVIPYNRFTDEGTGFSFRNYSADELYNASRAAIELYCGDKAAWQRLTARAMAADFGWSRSAGEYLHLYKTLKMN